MTTRKKIIIIAIASVVIIVWIVYLIISRSSTVDDTTQNGALIENSIFEVDGVRIEILEEGSGSIARLGDRILINYVGAVEGGRLEGREEKSFMFILGEESLVKGWTVGIEGMRIREKRRIIIPPALAYGSRGLSPSIPPNATLVYEITLIGILP